MWLKVGTRGDWRVIYVIIAFLVFVGLHDAYYQLYDLNDGPAKQKKIVREVNLVMPLSNDIKLHGGGVTEHIGGGREFESIVYSELSKKEINALFLKRIEKNGWKKVEGEDYFKKDNMQIRMYFADPAEYAGAKQMKGKNIIVVEGKIE